MADVDRGQLIAVAGLVLAIVLVNLALVLNAAIYTGNVATRETNHDSRAAMGQQAAVDEAVARAMQYVNVHHPSEPHDNLTEEIEAIDGRFQREVMRGRITSIRVTDRSNGTRIAQTDADRNFTDRSANGDWRLVDDTEGTHQFDMLINRSSLFNAGPTDTWDDVRQGAFQVNVTDESGATWTVYIYRSSLTGNAYLSTAEPDGGLSGSSTLLTYLEGSCTASGSNVSVDLVRETFGGGWIMTADSSGVTAKASNSRRMRGRCPELAFYDPSENYTVEYRDASAISGQYELLVDAGTVDPTPYHSSTADASPFVHSAIREATVTMDYQTTEVGYRLDWTTEPRIQQLYVGAAPRIVTINISDLTEPSTSTDPEFEVEWRVTDESGDLGEVSLYLYNVDDNDETPPDEETGIEVSGDADEGNRTLKDEDSFEDDEGDTYKIRIEVEDETGQVTSETRTDVADGSDP